MIRGTAMIKTLPQGGTIHGNLMSCALKEGLLEKSGGRMMAFPFFSEAAEGSFFLLLILTSMPSKCY